MILNNLKLVRPLVAKALATPSVQGSFFTLLGQAELEKDCFLIFQAKQEVLGN